MGDSGDTIRYPLPDDLDPGDTLSGLAPLLECRITSARRSRHHYLDTFDWRLYGRGWELVRDADGYRLGTAGGGERIDGCRGDGNERFWWDFPVGSMRERIRGCIAQRALIPLFQAVLLTRNLTVVNKDEKTVVRGRIEGAVVSDERGQRGRVRTLVLCAVRGYDEEFRSVRARVEAAGLIADTRSHLHRCLGLVGREPGDYSSKLALSLDPGMPAREAAVVILCHLLAVMRRNEPGIIADIDTEFVHDFRVAVRRTRAALAQLKDVLPAAVTDRFKADFAAIGRATNRLRDLDVYLLNRVQYRSMVPPDLRPGLDGVFAAMERERADELEAVRSVLTGDDYRRIVVDWEQTLATAGSLEPSSNAGVPVRDLARHFIYRRFLRVIRDGEAAVDGGKDAQLHALRIDCKKLRYLLEFFSSVFPPEVGEMVRQLKRLQDTLGDFNDYSVQQSELRSYLGRQGESLPTAAVGGLISSLYREQSKERGAFASRFEAFASQENRVAFTRLFGPEDE